MITNVITFDLQPYMEYRHYRFPFDVLDVIDATTKNEFAQIINQIDNYEL